MLAYAIKDSYPKPATAAACIGLLSQLHFISWQSSQRPNGIGKMSRGHHRAQWPRCISWSIRSIRSMCTLHPKMKRTNQIPQHCVTQQCMTVPAFRKAMQRGDQMRFFKFRASWFHEAKDGRPAVQSHDLPIEFDIKGWSSWPWVRPCSLCSLCSLSLPPGSSDIMPSRVEGCHGISAGNKAQNRTDLDVRILGSTN